MSKERAIETTLALGILSRLQVGEVAPYEDFKLAIGRDPQADGYPFVMSARKKAERDLDMVLEAVPNLGIKRLPPREVINRGGRDLKHVRKSIRAGMRRQTTIVPVEKAEGLTPEERRHFFANLAHFGVLNLVTSPSNRKRVAEAVNREQRTLEIGETLALFGAKK